MLTDANVVIEEFQHFINAETYPCVAARAAVSRGQVSCMVTDHMSCPKDDPKILLFIYDFVEEFRKRHSILHSAAIIFAGPQEITESTFETLLWQRLQALSDLDAENYGYDSRVSSDPSAANFSFSLAEEAFFIIGMHPASARRSRQFKYPAMVFNPHFQFEEMRRSGQYEKMKNVVRRRDTLYSGSINPMLADFGDASEVHQYSGRRYDDTWTCPLKITHGEAENNSSEK
ncbi:MAG TPA: guanitoxin biosynthesis heme-dependent pre-guanitoxin N-hydroxylase GntA [Chryseosolibacter sp.]|nr:guanitoxin biosynthesis heme-dependent pre-guanitoxin N-hydroxylase GntA [Chryseosolibacter sp.]